MSEKMPLSSAVSEKKEGIEDKGLWKKLAGAFGGYSQVPDSVVGMAIAGQMNNGGLSIEDATAELDRTVKQICERWEDQDPAPNADEIRKEIIRGMKEMTKDWTEDADNKAVAFVRMLEEKK
ncbi:MAG: hypothetical protein WCK01_05585 [Candidatus Uhrbacteria bacterium]